MKHGQFQDETWTISGDLKWTISGWNMDNFRKWRFYSTETNILQGF